MLAGRLFAIFLALARPRRGLILNNRGWNEMEPTESEQMMKRRPRRGRIFQT